LQYQLAFTPPNRIPLPFGIGFPAFGDLSFPPPKKLPTKPAASNAPLAKLDNKLPADPNVDATLIFDNLFNFLFFWKFY